LGSSRGGSRVLLEDDARRLAERRDPAFGQLELWSKPGSPSWLYVVALVFTTGVLVFRRLNMLGASLLAMGGASSLTLIDAQLAYDTATIFFAVLLATWTIASHAERLREAVVGWFAAIATAIFVTTQFPEQDPGDYFWIPAFFTATWLAGWAVNHRGRQAREAVERAQHERETAIADERTRIARELHDVVAHSVSVMTVQAGAVRRLLREDQEREREALLSVEDTGRTALAEMRRLLGMLREGDEAPSLAPVPGIRRARPAGA
jgi:signal transduction histidine kinase